MLVYRILHIGHIVKKYQEVNVNGVFHLHNPIKPSLNPIKPSSNPRPLAYIQGEHKGGGDKTTREGGIMEKKFI